ncbi:NAD(P)-dependent oxidoreductase [Vibrio europaeus]|uniref:SDR family oxidoreductase n=1 Tax=Vibrio europaeus TaxID=300876 RepID=A0AAE7DZ01_9VIBR|nr:NAD(P)H-binding protein [Vibrio europaeus]MDC5811459.1 SDR family oxidoreductase [Vibrio europaeus]MDC5838662.1 SDR family oxidoreductase [Vibrio europaeus]MDC5856424.1 SDR family oxidoreductase [Vibrio europaeus]NOH24864.1 NAD(P)H-binding protein [Vibrio europaeus]QJY39547.1 SDR family oxidoreductase [Vibrio europaeus]
MTTRTIAIIGGTGRVGKQVIKEALVRGYQLRVLARTPSKVEAHPSVTVIKGDALDRDSLDVLLQGAEAVVSTLGPAGMNESLKAAKQSAKAMPCFNSTRELLPLFAKHNIRRFMLTGGISQRLPEDNNSLFTKFMLSYVAPKFLGDISIDREKEYQLLKQSDIEWTIARCGKMEDDVSEKPLRASGETLEGFNISIHNIADFLLTEMVDKNFIRRGVYLSN